MMLIGAIAQDVLPVVMFVLQCDLNNMIKYSELIQRFGDPSLPFTLFIKKGFKQDFNLVFMIHSRHGSIIQ